MLQLYTDKSNFDSNEVLSNNDGVFSKYLRNIEFTAEDKTYMWKYDEAKIIGENTLYGPLVTTKYGTTHITNLSTGLKTLLNLAHFEKINKPYKVVDITECGENILMDIFIMAKKKNSGCAPAYLLAYLFRVSYQSK